VVDFRPQRGHRYQFRPAHPHIHRVLQQINQHPFKDGGPSTWIKVSGSGRERLMGDDKPGSSILQRAADYFFRVNHSFFKLKPD
ncbi:hypothetical protein, partial [Escherichia coli]|uniref:hypothetical protein n=1 Tax=Escherichia coli TaxID=562 RepID=UPI003CC911D6